MNKPFIDINIYTKYKTTYINNYSYRVDYDEFREEKVENESIMTGDQLIEMLLNLCKDSHFSAIFLKPHKAHIEHFDPLTGEGADIDITFVEVPDGESD